MSFPNRTFCDTLEEQRKILDSVMKLEIHDPAETMCYSRLGDTSVFIMLRSLVEECQVYGNRMEAALSDKADIKWLHKEKKKLEDEIKELKDNILHLGGDAKPDEPFGGRYS